MSERIIQEVNTFDLVAALGPDFSCDRFGWLGEHEEPGDMMTGKIEDVLENYSDDFINQISSGRQHAPIVVGVNGWDEYGDGEGWTLGNGNHRLALAIALMLPTVLVEFTEQTWDIMCGQD